MDANKVIEIEGIRLNAAAIREIKALQVGDDYPKKHIKDVLMLLSEFGEAGEFAETADDVLPTIFGLIGIERVLETLNVGKEVRNETV